MALRQGCKHGAHNVCVTRISDRPWLRALTTPVQWLLALVILFEEWGWEPLQNLLARWGQWRGLRRIEDQVRALPPWAALTIFGLPTLALLPVKLLALWAMGSGHFFLGTVVVVAAKVVGTAVVARLFSLTQPALMRLAWFAALYLRWLALKRQLLARVRGSWPWRAARAARRRARQWWRAQSAARRKP